METIAPTNSSTTFPDARWTTRDLEKPTRVFADVHPLPRLMTLSEVPWHFNAATPFRRCSAPHRSWWGRHSYVFGPSTEGTPHVYPPLVGTGRLPCTLGIRANRNDYMRNALPVCSGNVQRQATLLFDGSEFSCNLRLFQIELASSPFARHAKLQWP